MNASEASRLANEYRDHKNTDACRAKEILAVLRRSGWKRLAELLENDDAERVTASLTKMLT